MIAARNLSARQSGRGRVTLGVSFALFAGIFGVRTVVDDPAAGIGYLYVLPVAVVAVEFGVRAGVLAAACAVALFGVSDLVGEVQVGVAGYLTRAAALGLTGGLVGYLAARRRAVEEEASRWFEISNALLAVASLDGYFTRLNPAWEAALGFSRAELMASPYVHFVHPGDLEAARAAAGALAHSPAEVINVETRYRTKEGAWRWLLWNARSDEHQIYVVAKDITDRRSVEEERDRLLTRVEAMARTDELTRLPNRRAWEEVLRREMARAARHDSPLCVVMLDIDRFKQYNDAHGHPAGDALLKDAAIGWRTAIRVSDFIARYGGEEFAAVLPDVHPPEAARCVVARLRAAVPAGQTCSAGLALWDGEQSPEQLVARADAALYEAKRAGRDRVVIAR